MAGLQLREPREGRADREALRVAGVDPGEERLPQAVHRLLAEVPAQEVPDRLVAVAGTGRDHEVEAHAQLAGPGEESAPQEGQDPRGHRQHHPLGQGMEAAPVQDEDRALAGVGRHQAIAEAQLPTERDPLGLLGEDRVRAPFEEEAAPALGAEVEFYPRPVAAAVELLLQTGIGGPYALALGREQYTRVVETYWGPVVAHDFRLITGNACLQFL